ncbi:hypothetical protein [Polymorphospora sp. NPDC050346]|uniref:hypothetical protein n=1 Tax=Polymorphospora sp. NPDC050346 TaxID=3155780 RepID=UPI00340C1226
MSSPDEDEELTVALEWLRDRVRHLPGATSTLSPDLPGAIEVRVQSDEPPRFCLLSCWHEPWTAERLGVTSAVSMSALHALELLDHATRLPDGSMTAVFIADDDEKSRRFAFNTARSHLAGTTTSLVVVMALGCTPGGGLFALDDPRRWQPIAVAAAVPFVGADGIDPDVLEELAACAGQGLLACVLDPSGNADDTGPSVDSLYAALNEAADSGKVIADAH